MMEFVMVNSRRKSRGVVGRRNGSVLIALMALLLYVAPAAAMTSRRPIAVRVVIVTTWEDAVDGRDIKGELHDWRVQWPMPEVLAFPVGSHPLQYDPKRRVLAILTGMATARAAASIMALGEDPRFDLSHAYWIVAGTAGVDPKVASAGSTAWARWIIDGDLDQELDVRDMPDGWPTGIVPYDRTRPYETPAPPLQNDLANVGFALNRKLVDWAFDMTRSITLPDDATLERIRAPYSGVARHPPFVLEGDGLMSARSWYGVHLTEWAERWVGYWTAGQGVFAMSAEEDTGILQALTMLGQDRRVRLDRILVLRGASDYTVNPSTMTAADFLAKETREGFPAEKEALDNLYTVASPVARALADDWDHTRDTVPGR
jgi:purine nucleoside permease